MWVIGTANVTGLAELEQVNTVEVSLVMLGIAGAMELTLGIIGIYGVISYTVSQRQREIGIRLALGAQRGDGFAARREVGAGRRGHRNVRCFRTDALDEQSALWLTPYDLVTFAAVAVLLILVALLACYIPARRAMLADPIVALRYE